MSVYGAKPKSLHPRLRLRPFPSFKQPSKAPHYAGAACAELRGCWEMMSTWPRTPAQTAPRLRLSNRVWLCAHKFLCSEGSRGGGCLSCLLRRLQVFCVGSR